MEYDNDATIALVHGLGGSAERTWRENGWFDLIVDAGRTPLGIDLLGHGTAPKPTEPEAFTHMASHVLAALPTEPVDAIGFSLGARTLLECAIEQPSRFQRLVLTGVGQNLFSVDHQRHAQIAAAIRGEGDPTDPFTRYFADLANDPSCDLESLRALLGRRSGPLDPSELGALDLPVLVVLGDRDFAGPAAPLVEALPNASFLELRNTDHFATPRSMGCLDAALSFVDAAPY